MGLMERSDFYDEVYGLLKLWGADFTGSGRMVVGLNAPQGAGKTTLGEALKDRFEQEGVGFLAVSVDDFYLTRQGQKDLAEKYSDTMYFQQRGYPGTHDLALGTEVLEGLKSGASVKVPRYDKSAFGGLGDRRPEGEWSVCDQSVQVILLEGWMLGFQPVQDCPESLRPANEQLSGYRQWYRFLDGFLRLQIQNFEWVVDWRVEAEESRKAEGKEGLSREAITDYAKMFLPAYECFTPTLENFQSQFHHCNTWKIGKNRLPTEG